MYGGGGGLRERDGSSAVARQTRCGSVTVMVLVSSQPQGRAYAAAPARRYTFDRTPYGWMEREVGSGGVVDPGAACGWFHGWLASDSSLW